MINLQLSESFCRCNAHAAAKKAADENGLGVPLAVPSQFPAEPETPPVESGKRRFHWASYALNPAGNEVQEIDYMANFNKRFNKVIFAKEPC